MVMPNTPSDFEIAIGRLTNLANNTKTPVAVAGDLALVVAAARNYEEVTNALEKSVALQGFYAGLLNMYDGGKRIEFKTADEWIRRLRECDEINKLERAKDHG